MCDQGAQSTVYPAERDGEQFVVKITSHEEAKVEVDAMHCLQHDNLLRCEHAIFLGEEGIIVARRFEGDMCARVNKHGALTEQEATRMLFEITGRLLPCTQQGCLRTT